MNTIINIAWHAWAIVRILTDHLINTVRWHLTR